MDIDFVGFDDLADDFRQLKPRVETAVRKKAVRAGGKVLQSALKKAAPRGSKARGSIKPGTLRRAVRVNYSKRHPWAWGGIKRIRGEARSRNYYFTLERGRKSYNTRNGPRAGSPDMARFAFILQTASAVEGQVVSAIEAGAIKALTAAAAKSKILRTKG